MNHFTLKTTSFALLTSVALGFLALTGGCSSSASSTDAACDNYFSAAFSDRCKSGTVSAERRGQIQARFRTVCQQGLAAPGTGITASYLDKCAAALSATACGGSSTPDECKTPAGTLTDGTACDDSSQCKSSYCKKSTTTTTTDAGTSSETADCGVCAATIAAGGDCDLTGETRCAPDTTCIPSGTTGTAGKCTTGVKNDVGGACGASGTGCKSGLSCDFKTLKCVAPGGAGATCSSTSDCQQPDLACVAKVCKARVGDGAACTSSAECQAQLGCNPTTHVCGKRPNAKGGEPCTSFTVCDTGSCNIAQDGTDGTCPTLIADGAACTSDSRAAVCDEFADCKGGVCKVSDPSACK